jgi:hypothetical protein
MVYGFQVAIWELLEDTSGDVITNLEEKTGLRLQVEMQGTAKKRNNGRVL